MMLHIKKNANKKVLIFANCLNLFRNIPNIINTGAKISIRVAVISTIKLNQNGK